MLKHIVSMTLKDDVSEETALEIVEALRTMPGDISDIRGLSAGTDLVRSERSADIGLIVELDDLEALQRYRVHPAHQKVLQELIRPNLKSVIAVDFEG